MFMHKLIGFAKKHPKILLSVLVLLTACVVYHQYIFGNYVFLFSDIGSDTTEQYIMYYNSIVNHIRNGNFSLWDFTNGFGTSMYQLNLFNPTLWLIYLPGIIFGPQVMPGCLIYVHILTMVLSALAVWSFLSCFSFSAKGKLIAAYIYAFNGFLTIWGQHYQFSIILIFFPLLLTFIEKSLQRSRLSLGTVICTGLMVLSTYYLSYMVLIATAFYLILRIAVLQRRGFKAFCGTFLKQCSFLLLGVGIGVLNLLPSYSLVYNISSRMSSSQSLLERCLTSFAPYSSGYYNTLLHRILSGNLQGISDPHNSYTGYANYYEAPNLFFSSLFLILFIQFLFALPKLKTDRRKKAVSIIAVAAGAFSVLIMFGSLIFNAFSYPFSRHTFILMPFFAILVAYMLDYIIRSGKFSITGACIAAFIFVAVYLSSARSALTHTFYRNALILCATALIMLLLLLFLLHSRTRRVRTISFSLLFLTVMLNVASDTQATVAGRETISRGSAYFEDLYGNNFQELTAYLRETDTSFYRMEKDYAAGSQCMDSLGQYYRGISTYNSTENKYILEFADKLLPNLYYINRSHLNFRQITDDTGYASLFGIKYLVSKNPELQNPAYALIRQFGDLYLYENKEYTAFAKFYTKALAASDYESAGQKLDTESLLSQILIVDEENEFTVSSTELDHYTYTPTDDLKVDSSSLPETVSIDSNGSLSWSVPTTAIPLYNSGTVSGNKITVTFDVTVNGSFDVEIRTDSNGTPYTATVTNGIPTSVTITLPENTDTLYFTTNSPYLTTSVSNFRFYYSEDDKYSSNAAIDMEATDDSHLTCNVTAPEDGLLFFPIPYEQGWQVNVDGQEATPLRADYGFIAVKLNSGEHTVSLTYHPPLLKEALVISISCMGICIIIAVLRHKKRLPKK